MWYLKMKNKLVYYWYSVDVVGSDNKNKFWGLANDFGGPVNGKILCLSHDTTIVFEDEDKHEWMTDDLVLLSNTKPLG